MLDVAVWNSRTISDGLKVTCVTKKLISRRASVKAKLFVSVLKFYRTNTDPIRIRFDTDRRSTSVKRPIIIYWSCWSALSTFLSVDSCTTSTPLRSVRASSPSIPPCSASLVVLKTAASESSASPTPASWQKWGQYYIELLSTQIVTGDPKVRKPSFQFIPWLCCKYCKYPKDLFNKNIWSLLSVKWTLFCVRFSVRKFLYCRV